MWLCSTSLVWMKEPVYCVQNVINKLGIKAREIFWQLLMERQFHKQIISALKQDDLS